MGGVVLCVRWGHGEFFSRAEGVLHCLLAWLSVGGEGVVGRVIHSSSGSSVLCVWQCSRECYWVVGLAMATCAHPRVRRVPLTHGCGREAGLCWVSSRSSYRCRWVKIGWRVFRDEQVATMGSGVTSRGKREVKRRGREGGGGEGEWGERRRRKGEKEGEEGDRDNRS